MALFIVLFEDNAEHAEHVRRQHMSAHLAFLERNALAIQAAGPLHDDDGASAGGLWVVEADGSPQVERLVRDDPFWPTGLRRSVRILAWTRVFADGVRRA